MWLAKEWKLPELYQGVIGGSHGQDVDDRPEARSPIEQYVSVSGVIADIWCWPETEQAVCEAISVTQNLLNQGGEILDPILQEIAESIPMISTLFEIDLGAPDEIQQTLQKAQAVLLNTSAV